jgi:hypothetical protein
MPLGPRRPTGIRLDPKVKLRAGKPPLDPTHIAASIPSEARLSRFVWVLGPMESQFPG